MILNLQVHESWICYKDAMHFNKICVYKINTLIIFELFLCVFVYSPIVVDDVNVMVMENLLDFGIECLFQTTFDILLCL